MAIRPAGAIHSRSPRSRRHAVARQSGSITPVVIACVVLAMMLCLLLADVGLFLAARHEAQNAADAAALAAVQQSFFLFASGEEPQAAAARLAQANGAKLNRLTVTRGGEHVQVEVSVAPRSLMLRGLGIEPDNITATAAAEVDVQALLASNQLWYTADPTTLEWLNSLLANGSLRDPGAASTLVVLLALQHLGAPYVWGATGPNSFDCSGLVCYVYAQIGVYLPRVTFSQVEVGRAVTPAELQPGDLVFFRGNAHVGIYLGGGWYIHAPRTGDVVRVAPLSDRTPSACRRVL